MIEWVVQIALKFYLGIFDEVFWTTYGMMYYCLENIQDPNFKKSIKTERKIKTKHCGWNLLRTNPSS